MDQPRCRVSQSLGSFLDMQVLGEAAGQEEEFGGFEVLASWGGFFSWDLESHGIKLRPTF